MMLPTGLFTYLKLAALVLVIVGLAAAYLYWRGLSAEAALVPGLKQTVASDDARANDLADALAKADAARDAADRALTAWQANAQTIRDTLGKEESHAVASTNPLCAPSDADRRLRNDALAGLTGARQASGAAPMPVAAGAPR